MLFISADRLIEINKTQIKWFLSEYTFFIFLLIGLNNKNAFYRDFHVLQHFPFKLRLSQTKFHPKHEPLCISLT